MGAVNLADQKRLSFAVERIGVSVRNAVRHNVLRLLEGVLVNDLEFRDVFRNRVAIDDIASQRLVLQNVIDADVRKTVSGPPADISLMQVS